MSDKICYDIVISYTVIRRRKSMSWSSTS